MEQNKDLTQFLSLTDPVSILPLELFSNPLDQVRFSFLKTYYNNSVSVWYSDHGDPLKTSLKGFFYVVPLYSYLGNLYGLYFRNVNKNKRIHFYAGDSFAMTSRLYLYTLWSNFSNFSSDKLIILCEGLFDCLYLLQFYPYVISLCGTALTEERIYILSQLGYNFLLFFDKDEAGDHVVDRFEKYAKDYNLMFNVFEYPTMFIDKDDPWSFLEKNINIVPYLNRYLHA